MRDDDYLNKTARDAAGAGWGLIGLAAAVLIVCLLVAAVIALFDSFNDEWWVTVICVVIFAAGIGAIFDRR